jgi:hypothetical protein
MYPDVEVVLNFGLPEAVALSLRIKYPHQKNVTI